MLALPIILCKYTAKGVQAYYHQFCFVIKNIVAFRSQRVTIYYSWQLFCTLLHFSPSCYLLNDRHYKVMGILFPSSYIADEEDSLIIVRDGYVVFEQSRRTKPAPPPPFLSHSKFISGVIFVKWMAILQASCFLEARILVTLSRHSVQLNSGCNAVLNISMLFPSKKNPIVSANTY